MKFSFKHVGTSIKGLAGNSWHITKTSFTKWWAMDPFRQSSIIAYYAIFSLPALLVIVITIAGFAFGADAVHSQVLGQVKDVMGEATADQIKVMLAKATETKTSVWATILGGITVVLGSIGVFVELQKTLNIIWEVEAAPHKGVWGFLRARVFSFGLILSIAFLLMISLVISTALAAASELLRAESSKIIALAFEVLNFIISLGVISALFALMFKFLPDAKITWRHVLPGALITGMLFTIGKTAIAFYFGKADPASGYGAAGSIVLILLWASYSSMILFLGAEFTHTYADKLTGGVKPSETGKKAAPAEQVHKTR
ncbi:MAG TPA: YihY/virulence factor BrkB family protein [Chitinophagales bacterium]|nr:YihY/virulence factor BrkB family protein [Chitinophagales bacterium]